MNSKSPFQFTFSIITIPFYFVLSIWIVYWIDVVLQLDLSTYGILPRTETGLKGVVFSIFLHGNFQHLINNSLPLFVLTAFLMYFYRKQTWKVIIFGTILSGFITWSIARGNSYHIGASGLIYVMASFIFFKGFQSQYYRLMALSLVIVFLYGGMIWYMFPTADNQISWEGHLAGFIAGFILSKLLEAPKVEPELKYDWQKPDYDPSQDKFMQRFDENGNFVNPPKPEEDELKISNILYHFKSNEEKNNNEG
jgi:membrane associated rhomboid family serine protease